MTAPGAARPPDPHDGSMNNWDKAGLCGPMPPEAVLGQVEAAVIVSDRTSHLRYANAFAAALFGSDGDDGGLAGKSLFEIGFADSELGRAHDMVKQVLRGRPWDGTFATVRPDGSRLSIRAQALPLRHSSGAIEGIVIIARQASSHTSQRGRERIALLERIGERLSRSLEVDVTLRHVAETLVPHVADHCFIDLFYGDKLIRRVLINAAGWTPPPGSWAQVGEEITYPEGHFCQQAMARMEPVVVASLADEQFPAPHQQSLRASEDVGLVSIVAAPLAVRGELLGVMSLALSRLTAREDEQYEADDRDFLGAIASRVAVAIDNAMLFEEERRTALAFQHSLLPQEVPSFDGLDVAWRYEPAKPLETHGQGIQTQVGGDWYDVIPLSAGRVGVVIGDVEGRGARAAAVMGQLRAALRAFAQDDRPPAEILRKLDDWCRALEPGTGGGTLGMSLGPASAGGPLAGHPRTRPDPPTVSCAYLVYDPWSRMLSFANAGHVAPVLVVGGQAAEMEIEHEGVLLGVRGKGVAGLPTYREETRHLPPGSALVLYTDGLVDRRQRADGNGHYSPAEASEMLLAAVAGVAGKGAQAIADAAQEAVPGVIDDDMAIIVIRTADEDLASWEGTFPAEAIRVSQARRQAHDAFRRWGIPTEQAELACLLVSEVVTNVVLHTGAPALRPELALEAVGGPHREPATVAGWDTGAFTSEAAPPSSRQFTLRLRRGSHALWVEVLDSDLRMPRIRAAGETDEGGRGLYLVDQLAARWGSRPTRDGKAVWFEIPVGGGRTAG